MKKIILFAIASMSLVSLTTLAAPADITLFQCRTTKVVEGKKPTQFSFYVENLNRPKGTVGYWSDNDFETGPVTMVPENSSLMLNDNYSIQSGEKGLRLTSDGDGCQFTTVELFRDTKFQAGYAAVKDGGCGATPFYSTVSCKTTALK